jgi:hypothetical protein
MGERKAFIDLRLSFPVAFAFNPSVSLFCPCLFLLLLTFVSRLLLPFPIVLLHLIPSPAEIESFLLSWWRMARLLHSVVESFV